MSNKYNFNQMERDEVLEFPVFTKTDIANIQTGASAFAKRHGVRMKTRTRYNDTQKVILVTRL